MAEQLESAQKLLYFKARRLSGYQSDFQYHFYKNNQPYNISGLGLQLKATNNGGPTTNVPLETIIEGSSNHIFRCLKESPEVAGLPLLGGVSTANYYLWLTMQGEVGRVLLAQTSVAIEPFPKDKDVYGAGEAQRPESFRIDLDDTTGTISGSLYLGDTDYGILYNAIANLSNATWPRKTLTNWTALLSEPLPAKDTIYTVSQSQTVGGKLRPAGLYLMKTTGQIEDLVGNIFRNATTV